MSLLERIIFTSSTKCTITTTSTIAMDHNFYFLSPGPGHILHTVHILNTPDPLPTVHIVALRGDSFIGIGVFDDKEVIGFPIFILPPGIRLAATVNIKEFPTDLQLEAVYIVYPTPIASGATKVLGQKSIFFKCRNSWFFIDRHKRICRVLQKDITSEILSYEMLI